MSSYRIGGAQRLDCDVLVIGSGAGGSAVADAMTAAGRDVLILEEGPYVPRERVPPRIPDAFLRLWRCSGLTAALGTTPVSYAEGCCVGGGTEINSAIFQRTPGDLLARWARDYRIVDFSEESLAGPYARAAKAVNASLTPGPLGRASELLREAGEKLGWQVTALERAQRACVGTNLCAFGCPTGGKQSMTATLIPQAVARGARLVAECRADRLVLERGRATAARATALDVRGRRVRVDIRARQIFVCAGAIHTPALLLRSRLSGPVGRSLRLHPTVKVLAAFDEPIDASDSRLPLYAITEFMPNLRIGGSLSRPGVLGMALAEDWGRRKHLLGDLRRLGSYYAMARASGRGSVRVLPGAREPLVRYALEPADWELLRKGLGALAKAMFAAGARRVFPSIRGHAGWSDPAAAEADSAQGLPRDRTNLMTIHLFSSCPMGEDARRCPVDSFGRVRGIADLHVADGSLIPEAPGVNPQATIMALAYRCAEHALQGGTG
jgi:choline dehydrogenase-like flavoprotein